jgi:DNA invertase Pin-like site-specific DNA recombinase
LKIGYARVSTSEQDTRAQQVELLKYGCPKEKIFVDTISGSFRKKPQLEKALEQLREGDELVVWKLDRISRSLKDLLFYVERIGNAKASFKSLTEQLDIGGPAGRALMQMLGVFAEFERAMIKERTRFGVEQAVADGAVLGRKSKLDAAKKRHLLEMINEGKKTQSQMANILGVNRAVICRIVAKQRVERREELA